MKVIKTANGDSRLRVSKQEWTDMGKKAGWIKKAKFIVLDTVYNRAYHADLIGKVFPNDPTYAKVGHAQTEMIDESPDSPDYVYE